MRNKQRQHLHWGFQMIRMLPLCLLYKFFAMNNKWLLIRDLLLLCMKVYIFNTVQNGLPTMIWKLILEEIIAILINNTHTFKVESKFLSFSAKGEWLITLGMNVFIWFLTWLGNDCKFFQTDVLWAIHFYLKLVCIASILNLFL